MRKNLQQYIKCCVPDGFLFKLNGFFFLTMKTATILDEIVCKTNLYADTGNLKEVIEKEAFFSYDFRETSFKKIEFGGVRLLYSNLKFKKLLPVKMLNKDPYIEMFFSLSGSRDIFFTQSNLRSAIAQGYHNIFFIPDTEFFIEPSVIETENRSLQIQFTREYFKRLMPNGHPLFKSFTDKVNNFELSVLCDADLPITNEMFNVLNDILHCEKEGIIKQLYIETNVLKLLQLQFEQYETTFVKKSIGTVKEYDVDKLHYARQLLEQNITTPYSLTELARITGLNDFKLKKGFKELFGNTVFGYLHELRMEKAKEMLYSNRISITEISEYCGYTYVQSFTKAFKQAYGNTPEKFRQQYIQAKV